MALKAVYVVGLVATIGFNIARSREHRHQRLALWGAYDVESFTARGEPSTVDPSHGWRQVAFGSNWSPVAAVVTGDGTYHLYGVNHDAESQTISLVDRDPETGDATLEGLSVRKIDDTHLEIEGALGGQAVVARLRLHDYSKAPYLHPFTWVDNSGFFR